MLTRVFNLMAAGAMTLFSAAALFEPSRTFALGAIIFFFLNTIWLTGAIGLCLNKKFGWLICISVALIMLTCSLWLFIGGYSVKDLAKDPTDGIGYMILFGLFGSTISACLIVGLIRIRKSCFQINSQFPVK